MFVLTKLGQSATSISGVSQQGSDGVSQVADDNFPPPQTARYGILEFQPEFVSYEAGHDDPAIEYLRGYMGFTGLQAREIVRRYREYPMEDEAVGLRDPADEVRCG